MRIKRVEIIGFKSFCDRAVVQIGESITGVVGPNGCGKSNIVDAIRWCMGEQSAKHLRGKAMEDVIFAGSETRGPAPMAEVSLTFDDVGFSAETLELARTSDEASAEQALESLVPEEEAPTAQWTDAEGNPIASPQEEAAAILADQPPAFDFAHYTEVTITRRLYRDGLSQYFINKTPCRLRDITDFFLGTGVGTKAYAIIEQGRIGQIVSSRPQDRRAIIEEAAGITKFKAKKKAAEKKLDQTRQNLMRVSDIVTELDKRMGTLRRQAQKAERYRKYKTEVKDIELWKFSHRWLELAGEGRLVSERLVEARTEREATQTSWVTKDAHVVTERAELALEERRLVGIQEQVYELDNRLRLGESKIGFERREAEELDTRIGGARTEIDQIGAQREQGAAELASRESELDALEQEVTRESAEVATREAAAGEARQMLANTQGRLDEARSEIGSRRTEIASADAQLEALARRRDEAARRLERVMGETEQHTSRVKELERESRRVDGALSQLRQTRLDLGSQNEDFETRRSQLAAETATNESVVETLKAELQRRTSRLSSLREIQDRYEGFDRGTRAVMQHADRITRSITSDVALQSLDDEAIRGIVADIVRAPEHLEVAVEAALGDRLGGILVHKPEVGLAAIGFLKQTSAGRTAFVALEQRVSSDAVPELIPTGGSGISGYTPSAHVSQPVRFEGEGGASSWISPAWEPSPTSPSAPAALRRVGEGSAPIVAAPTNVDDAAQVEVLAVDTPARSTAMLGFTSDAWSGDASTSSESSSSAPVFTTESLLGDGSDDEAIVESDAANADVSTDVDDAWFAEARDAAADLPPAAAPLVAADLPRAEMPEAAGEMPHAGASDLGASDLGASDLGASDLGASDLGASDLGASDLGVSRDADLISGTTSDGRDASGSFDAVPVAESDVITSARVASAPGMEGVIGRLSELVAFADGYADIGKRLLAKTLVVDDLARAIELHRRGVAERLVTLDGDVVDEDGVVAGGSRDARGAGVLAQKREIRDLEEMVGRLEHELAEATAKLLSSKAELAQVTKAIEGLRKQVHEGEIAITGHEKDELRVRGELERHREQLGRLGAEQLELEERLRVIGADEQANRDKRTGAIARIEELERAQLDLLSDVSTHRDRLEELANMLTEARIRAAQLGEKRAAAEAATLRLQRTDAELAARADRLAEEIDGASRRAATLREGCDQLAAELALVREQRDGEVRVLDEGRTAYQHRLSSLTEVEMEARELRTRADRLGSEVNQLELRDGQVRMTRQVVEDQVCERYQIEVPAVLTDYHLRSPVSETEENRLTELRELIDRMGTDINLTAIEEYAEVSQRFEFLSAQKIDLERAVDQLQRAIDKINRTSRKLFKDTFDAVNATFKEVYPRLFRGGQASLSLTMGPERGGANAAGGEGGEGGAATAKNIDLLEAGIEIMAQPPGKKNTTVDQLSGGEKALTAVALVFSIFLIKPSPFCILDEVDAPLDEANVDRYNELVREMTDRSQFIVITHNKRTMEAADNLYGVTMQEPGVSKLVTVNLSRLGSRADVSSTTAANQKTVAV